MVFFLLIFQIVGRDDTIFNVHGIFGDVTMDVNNNVRHAHSFLLTYNVRFNDTKDVERSTAWLDAVRDYLQQYDDPRVHVYFMTSLTVAQEIANLV